MAAHSRAITRLCAGFVLLALAWAVVAQAQEPPRAGLVIVHGDGRVVSRCMALSDPTISGYDLLLYSGLDLNAESSGMGMTICRIDQEGCTTPQESCFCRIRDGQPVYWSYWQWREGGWGYSQLGASNSRVGPGAVDAWVWGTGNADEAAALQAIDFNAVCVPVPPTPTVEWTATEVSTASPTATLVPTYLPAPPTSTPTSTPTITPTFTPWPTSTAPATPTYTPWPTATESPTSTETASPTVSPTGAFTELPTATFTPASTATPTASPTALLPSVERLVAEPSTIQAGERVNLQWEVRRALTATLAAVDPVEGEQIAPVALVGSLWVAPVRTTQYRLTAWHADRKHEVLVEVVVLATSTPTPLPLPVQVTPDLTATVESTPTAEPIALLPQAPTQRVEAMPVEPDVAGQTSEMWLVVALLIAFAGLGIALLGLAGIVVLTWLLSDWR